MWLASGGPPDPLPRGLTLDPTEGSALRLPEARARRARHALQLAPHALNSNSAHANDGLCDPSEVRRHTSDDAKCACAEDKTIDANNRPLVVLIFARQRTSTVTLTMQRRHIFIM